MKYLLFLHTFFYGTVYIYTIQCDEVALNNIKFSTQFISALAREHHHILNGFEVSHVYDAAVIKKNTKKKKIKLSAASVWCRAHQPLYTYKEYIPSYSHFFPNVTKTKTIFKIKCM